jgi:DNA-binding MarR family transcriptional regulator
MMRTKLAVQDDETDASGEAFELEDFLPYRLAVAAASVSRLMARRFAETYGLAISEWRVLAVVGKMTVLSPSTVGAMASMDKVKVSRAAASLVARGLLRQSQDPEDGRGRLLRLTRKGATTYRGMTELARELEEQLSAGLSRTEWSSLQRSLSRLEAHARGLDEPDAEAAD